MAEQLHFEFKPVVIPRGDGSFIVRPGKMVVREEEISVSEAAKILSVSCWSIYRYIDEGELTARQVKPNARKRLIRSQVEALAALESV